MTRPRSDDPAPSEASLDQALDNLERMLGQDHAAEATASGAGADGGDPRPDLPLLDEVVARGASPPALPRAPQPSPDLSPGEAALCRRVAARLASEIDVIVQARLEQTLATACREIRKQVKEHIAITLPELIQDAAEQLGNDPD